MPKIVQLSPHIANLIAAGEVVERPASVVKELLENAVDAGASQIIVEIRDGGMTFLRVTDNGCGMSPDDARTAFLRHATSKLRTAEDLAAITTMGFRGEALAAIASVSRIDILTKTPESIAGTSLHLEAGVITQESEAGCPDGTTIIVRDLFFNTPARMKFMKSDTVEGSRVTAALQMQALAHPSVAFRFIRDGKQILSTPGTGQLQGAVYSVYGRDFANMIPVDSRWEGYHLTGFVSKPTDARPSRNLQTFFVNDRPVKSRLLTAALEEAYRNQIMVGKFPACVLHLSLAHNAVDVNVHPAKTEVKFLSEKAVFDCVHYGVLGAINTATDRPEVKFKSAPTPTVKPTTAPPQKQDSFFRTMSPNEFKVFTDTVKQAPLPQPAAAAATVSAIKHMNSHTTDPHIPLERRSGELKNPVFVPTAVPHVPATADTSVDMEQTQIPMPNEVLWRIVGELYNSYILVEQGDDAFLIDKHAAHERILFEKLKAHQESITAQSLITPIPCQLTPEAVAELLTNTTMLDSLGFEISEFGNNTVLLRQIPMDLDPEEAVDAIETLAVDLLNGRREDRNTVRDSMLHTVACKAAIKAGWHTDDAEITALVAQVMQRDDLKHCPHGRPICISLSKKQLEKQFKRT